MNVSEWLFKNAPSMSLIGEFNGYKSKSRYKCNDCGAISFVSLNSMKGWSCDSGCKFCSNARHLDKIKKMKHRLSSINPSLVYVSGYIDCGKTARFKCSKHNIYVSASMQSIAKSNPCKKCRLEESLPKRKALLTSRLERECPHIELIGEFADSRTETEFKCKIHNFEWTQKPGQVGKRHNCSICGMSEYKTLYLMVDSNGMSKIGITKQNYKKNRAMAVAREMGVTAIEVCYCNINDAYAHEQKLLSLFDDLPYTSIDGRYWREFRNLSANQINFVKKYMMENGSEYIKITN